MKRMTASNKLGICSGVATSGKGKAPVTTAGPEGRRGQQPQRVELETKRGNEQKQKVVRVHLWEQEDTR